MARGSKHSTGIRFFAKQRTDYLYSKYSFVQLISTNFACLQTKLCYISVLGWIFAC